MQYIFSRVLITAFALVLVARVMPGIAIDGIVPLIVASVVLGLLNTLVRPVLVVITLPVTILTLGLFLFVINGFLFYGASMFVDGFYVQNFVTALIGSLLVTVVSTVANRFIS